MNDLKEYGELKLEKKDVKKINESFCSESLSDEDTKLVIKEIYKNQGKLIDPHTAVAVGVANKISLKGNIIVLSTAHPSKFSDVVMKETNIKPELPENVKNILIEKERYEILPKDLNRIKEYILKRI